MLDTEHTGSEYWTAGQNKKQKTNISTCRDTGKTKIESAHTAGHKG